MNIYMNIIYNNDNDNIIYKYTSFSLDLSCSYIYECAFAI